MNLTKEITQSAIRLNNDINGNPRYYLSIVCFIDAFGEYYRPFNAIKLSWQTLWGWLGIYVL